jgi:hypothetical protein
MIIKKERVTSTFGTWYCLITQHDAFASIEEKEGTY